MRLVNIGKLITQRKEKNMKEKEALEYEPFLNVKEGENLKLEVAEYDKKNNGVYNCYNEDKTAKFFDEKSGNFHLMPKDKDKVKEYLEKEIEKKGMLFANY